MENEKILSWIRVVIREEVKRYMDEYLASGQVPVCEPVLVKTAELCKQLHISKQTLYNWLKHPKTKVLIEANRREMGGKVSYDMAGIKEAMRANRLLFGSGRDYGYKDEFVLSDRQKTDNRFREINSKLLLNVPVSEYDLSWYKGEKDRREG